MSKTPGKDKWILYKHTCNYEMIKAVALDVKNSCKTDVSDVERHRMQDRLAALQMYHTRNPKDRPLDSINHRINTLEFWMFGYEAPINNEKKFIFSPLGNLFLKHINDESKLTKIFTAMLFGVQYPSHANGTSPEFQLYPFRLIFQLLLDERLGGVLYNDEVERFVMFVKKVTPEAYEELVGNILKCRTETREEKAACLKSDESTYVKCVYEWEYYTSNLLREVGIFDIINEDVICKLQHPTRPNSQSKPTYRTAKLGYICLNKNVGSLVWRMLSTYSCFEEPIIFSDSSRLYLDCVKEVYNFYPKILLEEISESDYSAKFLDLTRRIELYSNNPDSENGTAYLFEDALTEGFNMFYNVEATKRGGAGHTDVECLYTGEQKLKKFAVEAKSTSHKLVQINAGRLRPQREEIGGDYTILITSKYLPAALQDIKGSPIVVLLANTFAEYLYNYAFHEVREIDYKEVDDIVVNHLGEDISTYISDLTLNKFAANSQPSSRTQDQ